MSWQARAGRAWTLALLGAGWGAAAHTTAHGASGSPLAGTLTWAFLASLLISWWLAPSRSGVGGRRSALRLLFALMGGQAVTHTSLSLGPVLLGVAHHGSHTRGWWTALSVGGAPMLLLHLVASLAVALSWAASLALWTAARRWLALGRLRAARLPAPVRRQPLLCSVAVRHADLCAARPRGPPVALTT